MKRRIRIFFSLILIVCMLAGCGEKGDYLEQPEPFKLYFIKSDGNGFYPVEYSLETTSLSDRVWEAIEMLKQPSEKLLYLPPFDNNVNLGTISINEDQLTLNFTKEYLLLDPLDETLKRAAIVMTLGQIPEIGGITFTIEGVPLADTAGNLVGVMTPDQFIMNAGKEFMSYEKALLKLYFSIDDKQHLDFVTRNVVYSSNISLDKLIIDELIKGPSEEDGLLATINPATKAISTTITDGVCYVNLDSTFLTPLDMEMAPEVTIYSIVNSLVELPGVTKVMISIDGDSSLNYNEVIPLSTSFERNLEIVK